MIRAAKTDRNHSELRAHARSLGFFWWDTFQLKNSCDAVLIYKGKVYFAEIKDGELAPSARKMSPGEVLFMNDVLKAEGNHILLMNKQQLNDIWRSLQ